MRFLVGSPGWPVGQWLIPPDTVLDTENWQWNGAALPEALPVCLRPLDQDAYNKLLRYQPAYQVLPVPPADEGD